MGLRKETTFESRLKRPYKIQIFIKEVEELRY